MSSYNRKAVRIFVIGTVVLLLAAVVSPTPWRWIVLNDDGRVLRINRFTGAFLVIDDIAARTRIEGLGDEPEDDDIDVQDHNPRDVVQIGMSVQDFETRLIGLSVTRTCPGCRSILHQELKTKDRM